MTTARRTVRRPGAIGLARGQRRGTAWDDTFVNLSNTTSQVQHQLLMANVSDPEARGCTLVRMVMGLQLTVESPLVASGRQLCYISVALASDDAFSGGALPDVNVSDDFPVSGWLYRDVFAVISETSPTAQMSIRFERDIRAQRKLDRASTYLTFLNAQEEGTGFAVRLQGIVRCLYKLP